MEEECEIFMDPEEDEIFFGKVTHKEVTVSEKVMKSEPTSGDEKTDMYVNIGKSDENHVENSTDSLFNRDEEKENIMRGNITVKKEEEKCESTKPEDDQILQDNSDSGAKFLCRGILEDIVENISIKEVTPPKPESPAPLIKLETPNKSSPNVQLDHNYSTPVRSIIDKSILATPKSVVKADKDGGFLKVLSEIAIVKAEADIEKSLSKEDEDKENKNVNVSLKVPEVKVIEATPDKPSKSPSPKKFNHETKKFRLVYNTPEKVDNLIENLPPPVLPEIKEEIKAEIMSEPVNDLKMKLENLDFLQKNLEEFENKIKKEESLKVERITPEKINLSDVPEIVDLTNSASKCVNNEEKKLIEKSEAEEIILDSSPVVKSDEKICEVINISSNSDVQILDNTPEQNNSTDEKPNFRMSEEARKVLEILNKKSADDSLNFTVQEIDVDKTHIPFDSPEISDLLNESLPKPSNKTELLRELLSATPKDKTSPIPFKTPVSAKVTSVKRFVVSQEKQKLLSAPLIGKKTPVSSSKIYSVTKTGGKEGNPTGLRWNPPVEKTSSAKKCVKRLNVDEIKTATPTPLSAGSARWNSVDKSGSVKKCVKRLNVDENSGKGDEARKDVQNNEKETKAPGTSKIPKFGQLSKIPVTGKKIVFPAAKGTPVKTPKPAAFAKIESPVNAYIHNKPTPLIKNIKPEIKKDSAKKVWMKQAAGSAKKINSEEPAQKVEPNRCKTALPFVEYRSATPLKFEKNIESKLPRLAPTMKKLITTNSPTVLKHEGRIHLNIPRKVVPVSTIDSSVMVDPNEVSVVVSHVAQKSNTISK